MRRGEEAHHPGDLTAMQLSHHAATDLFMVFFSQNQYQLTFDIPERIWPFIFLKEYPFINFPMMKFYWEDFGSYHMNIHECLLIPTISNMTRRKAAPWWDLHGPHFWKAVLCWFSSPRITFPPKSHSFISLFLILFHGAEHLVRSVWFFDLRSLFIHPCMTQCSQMNPCNRKQAISRSHNAMVYIFSPGRGAHILGT